jgi:Asp-tRNA(Asn)/Glu-tRNA(Gln) amidotransferase A subunit family amidase
MLGGRFGAEETLLALAARMEAARPWQERYVGLGGLLTDSAP